MRIIQIIRIRVMFKFCLHISGMDLDNYGFINYLISSSLTIIMKMTTLLGIFHLKIISGLFSSAGGKLKLTHRFINRITKISRFVVSK